MSEIADLSKKIDELKGHVLAAQIAVRSLILQAPDPIMASAALADYLHYWQAGMESSPMPEGVLAGFHKARKWLLPSDKDTDTMGF